MTSTTQTRATPREIIDKLVGAVDGELSTRSRVVDGLLDLRNASLEPRFTGRVDELLADLPGVTTVPNRWWTDRLAELRGLHD